MFNLCGKNKLNISSNKLSIKRNICEITKKCLVKKNKKLIIILNSCVTFSTYYKISFFFLTLTKREDKKSWLGRKDGHGLMRNNPKKKNRNKDICTFAPWMWIPAPLPSPTMERLDANEMRQVGKGDQFHLTPCSSAATSSINFRHENRG